MALSLTAAVLKMSFPGDGKKRLRYYAIRRAEIGCYAQIIPVRYVSQERFLSCYRCETSNVDSDSLRTSKLPTAFRRWMMNQELFPIYGWMDARPCRNSILPDGRWADEVALSVMVVGDDFTMPMIYTEVAKSDCQSFW